MIPLYDINPPRSRPRVTRALIILNIVAFCLVWILELRGVHFIAPGYGLVPTRITLDPKGEWFTIFTSMFLHGGLAHLGWNMLFLYIFGDNVEDRLGPERFTVFYFLSGLGAALGQYLMDPWSSVPMIGASGAIGGVLGAYLVLHPRAPVAVLNPIPLMWLFMPLLSLPAWLVVGEWFIVNLFGALAANTSEGGVAFAAHLGGFVVGLVTVRSFARSAPPGGGYGGGFGGGGRVVRPSDRPVFWRQEPGRPFWK